MTDLRRPAHGCLSDETIAAWVDGRLDPEARADAERHAAACEDCYRTFVDVGRMLPDFQAAAPGVAPAVLGPVPARVTGRRPRPRRMYVVAGTLAAAAALVVAAGISLFLALDPNPRSELRELVTAAGATRPAEARLTGGFDWAPLDTAVRGGSAYRPAPSVQIAAARLEEALGRDRSAVTLAAFGTSRLVLGDAAGAVTALEEATATDSSRPEFWSDLAGAYLARSDEAGNSADLPRALNAAETAIGIDGRLPEAWFNKALALEKLGLTADAREAWTTYLALDTSSPWRDEAERHLESLPAKPGPPTGRTPDAEPLRQTVNSQLIGDWASTVIDGAPSAPVLAKLRATVADIDRIAHDRMTRDVLETIERADAAPAAARRSLATSHAAFVRGQRAMARDDFDAAAAAFRASLPELSRAGSPHALTVRYNEAVIAYRRRDNVAAGRLFLAVRSEIAARGYQPLLGRTDWMLGLLDALQGRWREAGQRYESALEAFEAAADPANGAAVRSLWAENHDRIGDPQRAWMIRLDALRGSPRPGVLLTASLSARSSGWLRAALVLADAAFDLAARAGSAPNMADALRIQAAIRADLGESRAVADLVAEARTLVAAREEPAWDRVRAEIALAEAQAALPERAAQGVTAATSAIEYFTRTASIGRLPELLAIRAALYRAAGDAQSASADIEAGLNALERQRAHLAAPVDQVTFESAERRLMSQLVGMSSSGAAADDAFSRLDQSRARDLTSTPAVPLTMNALQAAMPSRTTFVEFVVGDDGSYAWIVTARGRALRSVPAGRRELADLVRAASPPRSDPKAVDRLSALLVAPIEAQGAGSPRLVVVPDGPLHALAFALLRQRNGQLLIRDYSLLVAPSAASWLRAAGRLAGPPRVPAALAAVGAPALDRDEHRNLRALPHAADEAVRVAALYPAARATVLRGAEATRDAVVSELRRADVVHFAGHAVANPWLPEASFLALAGPAPSRLTAGDIRRLALDRSRLVVLAACETAGGAQTIVESPLSLSRAFLAAGAPTVVGSLWLASDRASRELFTAFHREFARHGDAAEALRQAQLTLSTSNDPTLAASHQWAGFIAIGASANSTVIEGAEP